MNKTMYCPDCGAPLNVNPDKLHHNEKVEVFCKKCARKISFIKK